MQRWNKLYKKFKRCTTEIDTKKETLRQEDLVKNRSKRTLKGFKVPRSRFE